MALTTQGFALSAMPRAPAIPANAGAVDVREIYDGVRQGLAAFENARRAPASMLLADATMAAGTAEAPLKTRQVLAQTEGIEAQTPLRTAILAHQASPEYLAAQTQALTSKGTRAETGAVQTARALVNAQMRVAEDETDEQAKALVAALAPMATKYGAASFANPQGTIDAGLAKTADVNTTKIVVADKNLASAEKLTGDKIASAEKLASDQLAMREILARQGFSQSEINARIAADSRIAAAKATYTGKIYETRSQEDKKLNEELAALRILDDKVNDYKNSALGSGPVVGSGLGLFARNLFGDTTGQNLAAAVSISMRSAIETMRGLGAMSEKEFMAAMSQLPAPTDVASALTTKMDYLNVVRPWLVARNTMFLERIDSGDSVQQAEKAVRRALPLIGPDGNIVDPLTQQPSPPAPPQAGREPTPPTAGQSAPSTTDQGAAPATPAGPEVGRIYPDTNGNKAKYLGDGKWEEIP